MKLVLATIALAAVATGASAFPAVQTNSEVSRLQSLLAEQAVACPKVDGAWYMTDPEDQAGRVQVWKVSCSTGQDYGIMLDRETENVLIDSWSTVNKTLG